MAPRKSTVSRPAPPIVVYAPLVELRVYEISEAELEKLEAGPSGQIHLSFALALLPAALTIGITTQTVTISPDRLYLGYLVAFWISLLQGILSLVRWAVSARSHGRIGRDIRSRMPARPGVAEPLPPHPIVIEPEAPTSAGQNPDLPSGEFR